MKFGHHGANHPVQDLDSGRVFITSQNHGFAVDESTLPANVRADAPLAVRRTRCRVLRYKDQPAFSFQGHPEASPGPHDLKPLFERFNHLMLKRLQQQLRAAEQLAKRRAGRAPGVNVPDRRMPKRTDIESILIIGAGPIVIGQACEFDYSGAQACKALQEEGYRVILVEFEPRHDHDGPRDWPMPSTSSRSTGASSRKHHREGAPRCAAADDGRPDRAQHRARSWSAKACSRNTNVELIAAIARRDRHGRGPRCCSATRCARSGSMCPKSTLVTNDDRGASGASEMVGLAGDHPAFLHAWAAQGGGIAYNVDEFEPDRAPAACEASPVGSSAGRRVGSGLERVRDGGGARPRRQLHHRLLDRERGPDGHAHRRHRSRWRRR